MGRSRRFPPIGFPRIGGRGPPRASRTDRSRKTSEDLQTFCGLLTPFLRRKLVPAARAGEVAVHAARAKLSEHVPIEGAGELVSRFAFAALGEMEQEQPRAGDVALLQQLLGAVMQHLGSVERGRRLGCRRGNAIEKSGGPARVGRAV